VLLFLVAALLASCAKTWGVTFDGNVEPFPDDAIAHGVLTADSADSYAYTRSGPVLAVTGLPTNASSNLRHLFWPAAAPSAADGQSCATWTEPTDPGNLQQGAALRVLTDADGNVLRAVTVTKNIFYGVWWVFNVAVWDTTLEEPRTGIAQVDMVTVVGGQPYPWHLCARTVGAVLTMKVWAGDDPEPAWGDDSHGGSVTLPPEWVYPGKAGWYIGHLEPGGRASFTNLRTWA